METASKTSISVDGNAFDFLSIDFKSSVNEGSRGRISTEAVSNPLFRLHVHCLAAGGRVSFKAPTGNPL